MLCPVIKLAQQLISIPSISPFDYGCQNIIADRLSKLGFKIIVLKCNNTSNLWAYKGTGITLSFAGHTDVVPVGNIKDWKYQPFTPYIKQGFLFGRGAADMKGALSAMIIAVENFIKSFPNHTGRLSFLITSDEESNADDGTIRIIEYLKSKNDYIDYCIIGEPTSNKILGDTIKIGRRGSLHANLIIYGIQGHIAYPQFAMNPIHHSILFLQDLINTNWSDGNKDFLPTNMQISNISSSINSDNVIPGELHLRINFRFGIDISVEKIKKKFLLLLLKFNLKYSIQWKISGQPFLNNSKKLIKISINAIKKNSFLFPQTSTDGGTSDGRFIKDIASEIIELGPSNNTIHKVNECIKIYDLQILSKIYEDIIKKILQ